MFDYNAKKFLLNLRLWPRSRQEEEVKLDSFTDAGDQLFRKILLGILYIATFITVIYIVRDNFFDEPRWNHYVPESISLSLFLILIYVVHKTNHYKIAAAVLLTLGSALIVFTAVNNAGFRGIWMIYFILIALGIGLLFRGRFRFFVALWGCLCIIGLLVIHAFFPTLIIEGEYNDLDFAFNYIIIYVLVMTGTGILKSRLDKERASVESKNKEIEQQNELLSFQKVQIQRLNEDLKTRLDQRGLQLSHALKEVSQREAYLRSLIDSQTTYLVRMTSEGDYTYVNTAYTDRFINSQDASNKGSFLDNLLEESYDSFHAVIEKCLHNQGIPQKVVFKTKANSEDWVYVDWEILCIDSEVIQAVGIDISDLMMAQEDLTTYASKLEKTTLHLTQRNKELTDFGYIISHNLRGSVANILGLTDLLDQSKTGDAEKDHIVEILHRSTRNLDQVIKDLNMVIDLRHFEKNDFQLLHVGSILDQIEVQLKDRIDESGAEISREFDSDTHIISIKPYLVSILYNLVSNGIKYQRPQVKPLLKIKLELREKQVILSVSDNGLGVDVEKYGDQLFSLYKRFHDHIEGKGLGLYLVKVQVESMGGKIAIESELNKGTTFFITLEQEISTVSALLDA
ncbi:MAG: ATP-binding protein [Bacteroidota bacterium]